MIGSSAIAMENFVISEQTPKHEKRHVYSICFGIVFLKV